MEADEGLSRLEAVDKLNEKQFNRIVKGFSKNHEIYQSIKVRKRNRIITFLENATGKELELEGTKIIEVEENSTDDSTW